MRATLPASGDTNTIPSCLLSITNSTPDNQLRPSVATAHLTDAAEDGTAPLSDASPRLRYLPFTLDSHHLHLVAAAQLTDAAEDGTATPSDALPTPSAPATRQAFNRHHASGISKLK